MVSLWTLCALPPANAQGVAPPASSAAEQAMADAVAAFKQRRFGDALAAAETAHAAGAGPDALEAIAVASLALGNPARAYLVYSDLAARSDTPPGILNRARRQSEALRRQTGEIALRGVGDGARVFVDDARIGTAPGASLLRVFPGTHRLRIETPGGEVLTAQQSVSAGGASTVDFGPKPGPADSASAPPPAGGGSIAGPGVPVAASPDSGTAIAADPTPAPPPAPADAPGLVSPSDLEASPVNTTFERIVLFGNLDATKRSAESSSTNVRVEVGPSYVHRRDEDEWGYYLEGVLTARLEMNDADADPKPRALNVAVSGPIDIFGNTETPSSPSQEAAQSGTETGTAAASPSESLGRLVGTFAKAGVKRYLSPTSEYFAFAELQVAWDSALGDENGDGGEDASYVPDARLLVGPGVGRIVNLSSRMRVRALEADLTTLGLIKAPLTAELRAQLALVYEAESDPLTAARAALDLLVKAGLLTAFPSFDDTMRVVTTATNALRFRLKGFEVKAGGLVPMLQSANSKAQNNDETPIIGALQVLYTHPYSDQIQITGQAGASYQTTPTSTAILTGLLRVDRKFTQFFQASAYAGLTLADIEGSSKAGVSGQRFIQARAVGQANFFVADSTTWQTTLQLTNTRVDPEDAAEDKETEIRLLGNFTYTF
jgi:hypothetical protein